MSSSVAYCGAASRGRPQRNPNPPKRRPALTPAPEPKHSAQAPAPISPAALPDPRFSIWFNWGYDSIERPAEGGNWRTLPPNILLHPGAIEEGWADPSRIIGLRFGRETRYFLIDIDAGSPYCDLEGVRNIRAALEDLGFNETVLIQSSNSGGLHLYGFLPAPVPTFRLAQALTVALTRAGLMIAPGTLEIFPNPKAYTEGKPSRYNAHRVPLQPGAGSELLNKDLLPFPGSESIELFLDWADSSAAAVDLDLLDGALETARSDFNDLFPKRRRSFGNVIPFSRPAPGQLSSAAAQWEADLQADMGQGWTGASQTNHLLYRIGVYGRVFLKIDSVEELAAYISATAQTMPGYAQFCQHQREIDRRAMDWAKSVFKHYLPYCNVPERLLDGARQRKPAGDGLNNDEKRAECMNRVADTVADLEASGRMPAGVAARRRLIAMLCNCSERTLAKAEYLPLWHPAYTGGAVDLDSQDGAESIGAPEMPTAVSHDSIGADVLKPELDHTPLLSGLAPDAQSDSGIESEKKSSLPSCRGGVKKDRHQAPCTSPWRRESDFSPRKTAQILDLQAFRENRRHDPTSDSVPHSAALDLGRRPRPEPVEKPEPPPPPSTEDADLGRPDSGAGGSPPWTLDPFVAHAVALFHAGGFPPVAEWLESLPALAQAQVTAAIQSAFSRLQEGRHE